MPTSGNSCAHLVAPTQLFNNHLLADPLTGCANRNVLTGRIEALALRPGRVAVLFAHVDDFGGVRNRHGDEISDRLLVALTGRLRRLIRPADTLARLADNTFVVLVEDNDEVGTVESLTARIDGAANGTFGIAGIRVPVTSTVGVAFTGRGEDVPDQIRHDTDTAIHLARAEKRAETDIDLTATTPPVARQELFERTV